MKEEYITKKEFNEHNKMMTAMVKDFCAHQVSSPETKENFNKVTTSMDKITKSVEDNSRNIAVIQGDIGHIKEGMKEIKDFIKDSPKRFASKHVEKVIWAGAGAILLFVINKLLNLI